MNTFTIILVCFQACLVQNVFGQACLGYGALAPAAPLVPYAAIGSYGTAFAPVTAIAPISATAFPAAGLASSYGVSPCGSGPAYGGFGEGNVAVAGQLPVTGTTAVAGQVPIMGAVSFGGAVPAAGAVSIAGQCACGCGAPYNYYI